MGLPTGGDGSAALTYNKTTRQWEIKTGGVNRVTVGDGTTTIANAVTFSSDVTIPGGVPQTFVFFKNALLQDQRTIMTASLISSGSAWGGQAYTRVPMVRSGSIMGLTLYGETSVVISGTSPVALTASVTLDGANVGTPVIITTGSVGHFIQEKDVTTFNGGQAIGVSLTASDGYLVQNTVELGSTSGSWAASVLVEY